MDINRQLIQWNARWMIMGDFIACKECLLPQQANDAQLPFEHDVTCSHYDKPDYPWSRLYTILSELSNSEYHREDNK